MTNMKILMLFLLLPLSNYAQDQSLGKKNVLGKHLTKCGDQPVTGYFRNGYCHTDPTDQGTHVVCATVTKKFLEFTKSKGNDLMTSRPEYNFPGLVPGDRWCLCALRWKEAFVGGSAPKIDLNATHAHALDFIDLSTLKKFSH